MYKNYAVVIKIKPLISIQNVCKIYNMGDDKLYALRDINLEISHGEFVSIVGQSGSGKSTLMNILGCLDTPTSGNYFLQGEDIKEMNDKMLSEIRNRKIGFIFQGFNLIQDLTALENVELPLIYRGIGKAERRELSMDALKKVGLISRAEHKPTQMSGGQQQRVAIARAIAAKPPIILADEPTGNLDSKCGSEVVEILRRLNNEGRTIILITHDDKLANNTNRVIRIQDGSLIYDKKHALVV